MPTLNDLPNDLKTEILIRVGNNSLLELARIRAVSRSFKELAQSDGFLKKVNLFTSCPWREPSATDFKILCLQHRNPSALFLYGASEFFREHQTGEGFEIIYEAAKGGSQMAQYCATMLYLLAMDNIKENSGIFEELSLSLDVAIAMRHAIKKFSIRSWDYLTPPEFDDRKDAFYSFDWDDKCSCSKKTAIGFGVPIGLLLPPATRVHGFMKSGSSAK
ncbi:putative F-box protein At1g67623 [Eutrema salsugineum]|uniref:putative F-box protein At1g67623 n=1 Tax=Eutrema salsugineum TaxID=72664 RepID=UPI000CED6E99|nr:putative F-box protein At1g67623 [Eutrema salsugineum]